MNSVDEDAEAKEFLRGLYPWIERQPREAQIFLAAVAKIQTVHTREITALQKQVEALVQTIARLVKHFEDNGG